MKTLKHLSAEIRKMTWRPGLVAVLLLTLTATVKALPQESQPTSPQVPASGQATQELTVSEVEAALAGLEQDAAMDSSVREPLRQKYRDAIKALQQADTYRSKAAAVQQRLATAPDEKNRLQAELDQLLPKDQVAEQTRQQVRKLDPDQLQSGIETRQGELASLREQLEKLTADEQAPSSPANITSRISELEGKLTEDRARLNSPQMAADPASPLRTAERYLLQATLISQQSELEMLKQLQAGQSTLTSLAQTQRELLNRLIENLETSLQQVRVSRSEKLLTESQRITGRANEILAQFPDDPEARLLAAEIGKLAGELDAVVKQLALSAVAGKEVTRRMNRLDEEYQYVESQIQLGGDGEVIAQLLLELRKRILGHAGNLDLTARLTKLDKVRLAELEVRRQLREVRTRESQEGAPADKHVADLVSMRNGLLDKLQNEYRALTASLSDIELNNRRYRDEGDRVLTFVTEKMFWLKCYPDISLNTLRDLPQGVAFLVKPENWQQLAAASRAMLSKAPVRFVALLTLVVLLLVLRPKLISALREAGTATRRISTDNYGLTLKGLVLSLLLALPPAISLVIVSFILGWDLQANQPLPGIASLNVELAWTSLGFFLMAAICRPGGLGPVHFRWPGETMKRFRKENMRVIVVCVPTILVIASTLQSSTIAGSLGRFVFIGLQVWILTVVWRLMGASNGFIRALLARKPQSFLARTRYLWLPVLLATPIALIVLAWRGYLLSGLQLSLGLLHTIAVIYSGVILYSLVLRWYNLKSRKLALQEALARRKARLAEARESEAGRGHKEMLTVQAEDEVELNLESINAQTRHVLQMIFSVSVLVAVALLWSDTIPLVSALDGLILPVGSGLSVLSLCKAFLVTVVTWVVVHNMPGLLELSLLRTTSFDSGSKYALARIVQYVVAAVGLVLLFAILRVDWSRFGWIAAALSVGLGFGLQEVVANFVCGLILLFERPVRVGDVVTIDGINGTVTRIQMRATTITNWDRQEFVVPNKNLITGTILNWTLSSTVSRIVIPVGVAYGTDTDKASRILLDAARAHEGILKEPEPFTTFEKFGDSSLLINLRCYVPNLDHRLKIINDLHSEIHRQFADHGIEIAFPQLDIHVRGNHKSEMPALADESAYS
jgi:potassium efflux system protein